MAASDKLAFNRASVPPVDGRCRQALKGLFDDEFGNPLHQLAHLRRLGSAELDLEFGLRLIPDSGSVPKAVAAGIRKPYRPGATIGLAGDELNEPGLLQRTKIVTKGGSVHDERLGQFRDRGTSSPVDERKYHHLGRPQPEAGESSVIQPGKMPAGATYHRAVAIEERHSLSFVRNRHG